MNVSVILTVDNFIFEKNVHITYRYIGMQLVWLYIFEMDYIFVSKKTANTIYNCLAWSEGFNQVNSPHFMCILMFLNFNVECNDRHGNVCLINIFYFYF